jgi:hypothetical protein
MPTQFGDVVFNITDIRVTPMLANGTYLTTSFSLDLGSEMSFSPEHDQDTIKAYGMFTNRLSILTNVKGMLKQAAMDAAALWAMTGVGTSTSGVTPNQVATATLLGGGSGLPYFGVVGSFAAENGANVLVGLYKCQLDTLPQWTVEQNKFRITEVGFFGMAASISSRKVGVIKKYETAVTVPTDLNGILA